MFTSFRALRLDDDVRRFFKALVPATIGSAGTQLALFADTIIASFLATGAISALYYADRIDQLPIGVIGIAVGTVLLPEMTHRIAAGDDAGARSAQNRAIEFTLLLSIPCIVAFLLVPDLDHARLVHARPLHRRRRARRGDDARGLYDRPPALRADPQRRRPVPGPRRTLHAGEGGADRHRGQCRVQGRADGPLAQVGLALATSIGAWINFVLVLFWAARAGHIAADATLKSSLVKLAGAGIAMTLVLFFAVPIVTNMLSSISRFRNESELLVLALIGGVVYGVLVLALFGRRWLSLLRGALRARRPNLPTSLKDNAYAARLADPASCCSDVR